MRSAPFLRTSLVLTGVLLTAQGTDGRQQEQSGTFRSATALVEVDVVVKDRDGRFVSGLTADDFEVFEDGQPQPIRHFYLVTELPTTSVEPRSDVMLPRSPDQTDRRILLLIFDSEHLSPGRYGPLKHAAMAFINEHLRPNDLGGVIANGSLWNGRLTSDRQELLDGIRAATPAFETTDSRIRPLLEFPRLENTFDASRIEAGDQRLLEEVADRNCSREPANCQQEGGREFVVDKLQQKAIRFVEEATRAALGTMNMISYVARNLSRLEGRKTIILISEGFFVEHLRGELPQIAGQAARAGITIYTLNARGTEAAGGRVVPDASVAIGTLSMRGDSSQESLDVLSNETGGLAFRNTDDFSAALESIVADTSTYYVLAYSPENAVMDGTFRRIELKTKWKGLEIRARRGYVATPLPPPKQLRTGTGR